MPLTRPAPVALPQSWYTASTNNVRTSSGKLIIEARDEAGADRAAVQQQCWDECGARCARSLPRQEARGCTASCGQRRCPLVRFTSGRVTTYGKFSVAPSARYRTVRVEARMRLPHGRGLWPAFWMLPAEGSASCSGCGAYGGWPASGEIDIVEAFNTATETYGSVHFGGPQDCVDSAAAAIAPGFHTFGIEWEQQEIRWYVDGRLSHTARSKTVAPNGWWSGGHGARSSSPFDRPFYLIINLAVGGLPLGSPSPDAVAAVMARGKRRLVVDFVRVLGRSQGAAVVA